MAINLPISRNTYRGTSSQTGSWVESPRPAGSQSLSYEMATERKIVEFLNDSGYENPPFITSTAGRITPNHVGHRDSYDAKSGNVPYGSEIGENPRIRRGYIRRANPDPSKAMSTSRLQFMYNPELIMRDYVSYMDQAALDPFNTLYESGNLVAPPSFINFSFELLFDRQIENTKPRDRDIYKYLPQGVLADYQYFDMVVRNVPPWSQAPNSDIPDNGVMMVNPEDITVIFSPELSVQGRPTNARVAFTKFNHKMVPIRMTVNLTMIVTYFGPLKETDPFGLDTNQDIAKHEALIPYSAVYDETYTKEQLDTAQKVWNEQNDARIAESGATANTLVPYSTAAINLAVQTALTATSTAASTSGPQNVELRGQALKQARFRVAASAAKNGVCRYHAINAVGVDTYSAPGLVWVAYADVGAQEEINGKNWDFTPTMASIINHQNSTGWKHLSKLVNIGTNGPDHLSGGSSQSATLSQLQQKLEPGDILIRDNKNGRSHIAFFVEWVGSDKAYMKILHARGPDRHCGEDSVPIATIFNDYSFACRPTMVGSLSTGAGVGGAAAGDLGRKYGQTELRNLWQPRCSGDRVSITLYGGSSGSVRPAIVDAVNALDAKLREFNYPVNTLSSSRCSTVGNKPGGTPSFHSYGIALDLNGARNPHSSPLTTDMSMGMVNAIEGIRTNSGAQAWFWGGHWNTPDTMHYQIHCSPADIATGIA